MRVFALLLLIAGLAIPSFRAFAHEGHDHDAPAPPPASAAPRAEAASDMFELVAVRRDAVLEIFLDRFGDNSAVDGAQIDVETAAGPVTATAAGEGIYRLAAPWAQQPGRYDLVFTVTAGDAIDILSATLVIPEPAGSPAAPAAGFDLARGRLTADPLIWLVGAAAFLAGLGGAMVLRRRVVAGLLMLLTLATPALAQPTAERDTAQRLADGAIFVPKTTQRILALRTQPARPGSHPRGIELPGRIIPDPNASGYVQAAVSGRLSAPPGGFPRLGTTVRTGDVLARVTPPLQAIDRSDIQQRASEIDQMIVLAERRIARYRSLRDVVTRVQVEEAEIELASLRDRRSRLDIIRRESEALVAPVDGVIAAANAVAGQITETNAIVFQIVDPARLWVEALSFEVVEGLRAASARLADGRRLTLAYRGAGLAGAAQATQVQFAVEGDTGGLRIGQMLIVTAEIAEVREGMAIPRASVLRGPNGQSLVWLHVAAERFEPREVRVAPLDAGRVLLLAGVEAGQRVVTQGAELLNQIR